MSAKVLHAKLQQLFIRDGLGPPRTSSVALAEDIGSPTVLEGLASTIDRDLEHCRFAPYAFGRGLNLPPLLYDHDPDQVAGTVDHLEYDAHGQLLAIVTANHPVARRCSAFSVGAKVREYVIHDDGYRNFEALITRAELTDLSLVQRPVNPNARVLTRRKLSEPAMFWHLMQQRVAVLQKMVTIIGAPAT